jgi:hypothetical protein
VAERRHQVRVGGELRDRLSLRDVGRGAKNCDQDIFTVFTATSGISTILSEGGVLAGQLVFVGQCGEIEGLFLRAAHWGGSCGRTW